MDYVEKCGKCGGSGHLSHYGHWYNGVCFGCRGSGTKSFKTSPEARAKARERYAKKAEAKRIVEEAKRAAKRIELAEEAAKEAERKAELEAKWAAELEAAEPVPTGRIDVSGKVLSCKYQESMYGSTLKMLVKDERGFKLWGTVPSSIYEVERGDMVSFTATVEPSKDDDKFGFFKRPSKAVFIENLEEVA